MEFTTHPTYHFMIGFPGSSSALEISKELGFPDNLIERAKTFLDKDWLRLSERLKSLASETEKTIMLNDKLAKTQNELEQIKNDYTSKLKNFKKFEQDEKQKIFVESRRFFSEHRRNIENLIRKIKESNAEKQTIVEAKNYVADQLNTIEDINLDEKLTAPVHQNQSFKIGDTIFSKTFQKQGVIVDKTSSMATIAFGSIKFELDYSDLEHAQDEKNEQKVVQILAQTTQTEQNYQQPEVASVLNIIGQHREEATISVQRFLDDAAVSNIHEVSIIHGKGKGILKDMLWDMLRNDTRVVQFRFGEPFEGGIGMTKIELR
jgi:DNA mismatch repair protein MutS2